MVDKNNFNKNRRSAPTPDPHAAEGLSLYELSQFRTEICAYKASGGNGCILRENCVDSHCLSWHRRNPFLYSYRPMLCPNTKFWTTEEKRMKVKTWCKRGRLCMFSHTKEEQMYHPLIYKTQICRDYPDHCFKPYCPFAHGLKQLKSPDHNLIQLIQGPEIIEYPNGVLSGALGSAGGTTPDDRIAADFAKVAKEREQIFRFIQQIRAVIQRASPDRDDNHNTATSKSECAYEASLLTLTGNNLAVANLNDWTLSPIGLIAVKLNTV